MTITRQHLAFIWVLLSAFLGVLLFLSMHYNLGTRFFWFLNLLNIALVILTILFWSRIGVALNVVRDKFMAFHSENAQTRISVEYRYGTVVGNLLIILVCAFGMYMIALAFFDPEGYYALIREDGPVEYASAVFWIAAALLLFLSMLLNRKRRSSFSLRVLPHFLLAIFFIVCAGEEISWGQRILDLQTPDFLKAVNVQNEITLHNIASISVFSNAFFLGTLVFFLLIPYIESRNALWQKFSEYYSLPVASRHVVIVFCISLLIWVVIGIRFGTLGFHPFSFYVEDYYNQMDDEIFECLVAYSFFCYGVMYYLKRTTITRQR